MGGERRSLIYSIMNGMEAKKGSIMNYCERYYGKLTQCTSGNLWVSILPFVRGSCCHGCSFSSDVFSVNSMSSTACSMHTVKYKNAYLVVAMRPFFLGQVFPRKLPLHQFPFSSHLKTMLTTGPRKTWQETLFFILTIVSRWNSNK